MKYLGTITKYSQFIDNDTKSIVESVMKVAYNYWDFVSALGKKSCEEGSSELLVFLTALHAANLRRIDTLEMLWENHSKNLLILPFLARVGVSVHGMSYSRPMDQEHIDQLFSMKLDDWIAFLVYQELWNYTSIVDLRLPFAEKFYNRLEYLVQNNPILRCFEPELLLRRAFYYRLEGDYMKSVECCESAYNLANQIDDKLEMAEALHAMSVIRNIDIGRAMDLVSRAKSLYEELGHKSRIAEMVNVQGIIHGMRGELSAALDCYNECIILREKAGLQHSIIASNISWIYSGMKRFNDAYEWGKMALSTLETQPESLPHAYTAVALALIGLNHHDEAIEYLDESMKLTLKRSDDFAYIKEQIVLGLIERAKGNISESISILEGALKVAEDLGEQSWINTCLLTLAASEVEDWTFRSENPTFDESASYLFRLEKRSRERSYLGFWGLALFLQAQMKINQGQRNKAMSLLREVRGLAQQPGLKFLEDLIVEFDEAPDFNEWK